MAENKTTTPKDNIKLLQSYKGEKFASLMQQIMQEKNRALVLKSAIKAKIVQINEIEFEQERAKAQESEIAVPVVDDVKVEEKAEIIVEKAPVVEVKEEKQEVKEVTAEKAEEKAKKPVKEKEAKPQQAKKEEKVDKAPQNKKTSQPVEIERVVTDKPNVWLIKYSDGTQREQYIPPEKPKKAAAKKPAAKKAPAKKKAE